MMVTYLKIVIVAVLAKLTILNAEMVLSPISHQKMQ